jgi:hypothetical protein
MNKYLASLIAFVMTGSGYATAEVVSADVNIVSVFAEMTKDNQFVCTAVINNQNDDASQDTKVIVLLPLQVTITGMSVLQGPGTCQTSQPSGQFHGYAVCDLGNLPQGLTYGGLLRSKRQSLPLRRIILRHAAPSSTAASATSKRTTTMRQQPCLINRTQNKPAAHVYCLVRPR